MSRQHLVRVGAMAQVGRFTSVDAVQYPRGARVVLRTARGLETGEILNAADDSPVRGSSDGSILRGMTLADELLEARLTKNKQSAIDACTQRITELGLSAVLLDVDHLFDGGKLFFYFMGEVSPELEAITAELADVYDAQAQLRQFAETLTTGCGPGCGTESATGQGCSSCATGCAVAGACSTRRQAG